MGGYFPAVTNEAPGVWKRRGAFHLGSYVSCFPAWETKTEARKKSRRLPSRSRNLNQAASARSSRHRLRRSRALYHCRPKCRTTLRSYSILAGRIQSCRNTRLTSRSRNRSAKKPSLAGWLFHLVHSPAYGCEATPCAGVLRACAFSASTLCALSSRACASGIKVSAFWIIGSHSAMVRRP
jgi:hypothetical protein